MKSEKKLKVLFVHEVSYETKVVFEMHEFPEFLSLRGHDIIFVDFPEHRVGWKSLLSKPRVIEGRAVPQAEIRLYSLANLFPSILGRLLAVLIAWIQIPKIIGKERPDIVVLYGVPTNGLQTIRAAHRHGIPVVHRSIDVSHLLRGGFWSKFVHWFEKRVFEGADLVVANNAALSKYIEACSTPRQPVRVLAPGILNADLGFNTTPEEEKFDFVFMGTLFRFSGLDWFIREMSREPKSHKSTLLIIGDGEDGPRLRELVTTLGLDSRVEFTGFVEFSNLKTQVLRGRIGILPFLEIPVARYALPGKVLQYVKFGIPTISTRLEGLMSYLPPDQGVIYSEPGNPFLLKATELLIDQETRKKIVFKGNETLDLKSNWTLIIDSFEQFLYTLQKDA